MQLPPDLVMRLGRLMTTRLDINVPPGTQISQEELLRQLYQFVESIEREDDERNRKVEESTVQDGSGQELQV